jgi:glycosyltransferase involved in cell wall biosynthesis
MRRKIQGQRAESGQGMKVAWLHDPGNADGTKGGAEYTMDGFKESAPNGIEFDPDGETVVVGNCVTFQRKILDALSDRRVIRYHHDLSYAEDSAMRYWMDGNAEHIFTSPLHLDNYRFSAQPKHDPVVIPPMIDLAAFRPNRQIRRNGKRNGIVTIGSWQNSGKGGQLVSESLYRQGLEADCYGPGYFTPYGDHVHKKGPLEPEKLPQILWRYQQFIFLPSVVEPFGRCVVEAWAAGCEVLTNELVGSRHFIENDPKALETASEDFWRVVCEG